MSQMRALGLVTVWLKLGTYHHPACLRGPWTAHTDHLEPPIPTTKRDVRIVMPFRYLPGYMSAGVSEATRRLPLFYFHLCLHSIEI